MPGSIVSRVLRQLGLGVVLGGLLAAATINGLTTSATHAALTTVVMAAVLLAIGFLAALGPARRGLRVQPMEALREE